ncbi:hypothetical protein C1645_731179 [Glomus cerebriforme]|uniref:Uncharacterized protein n=1 Tax=Glomus cerebriforme TaxID=658196 RepID=A0A397TUY6_9GLOM|nr:hypothetical protein C1645_731179 [Glomus cerebriforme]
MDVFGETCENERKFKNFIRSVPSALSRFSELSFLSSGSEWEFGGEPRVLGIRELRRNEHMVSSSITETRATNRNLCNNDIYITRETTLQELPNDREPQHTQNLPLLLKLLNNKYPYRDEANKNILDDLFWLEDPDGVIYFWSRIDDSMIRGGGNLKEALTNYLFHRENLCYDDEFTRELVPINAYDKEAEEWTKSPEKY